jgi:hypothetical protein
LRVLFEGGALAAAWGHVMTATIARSVPADATWRRSIVTALFALTTMAAGCGGDADSNAQPPATRAGTGGGGGSAVSGNGGAGTSMGGGETDAAQTVDSTSPVDTGGDVPPMLPPPTEEPLPPCLRTVPVASSAALSSAISTAKAGDCIVLADGDYAFPNVGAKATEANPIVIRAANVLKAIVSAGNVQLQTAAYVVVEGVHFQSSGSIRLTDCDHCRVSRFRIQRKETGVETDWVTVGGTSHDCRVDHNDFGPQAQVGNMVMLAGAGTQIVQHTRIDHNYFHDVNFSGGNGWELIRAGLSGWTFSQAYTVIEQNLFLHGDSDPETISVKSSDNTIRYNTMRATAGQFTLRHGNRTSVYGNYILGDGVNGSAGLRVYGGDHKIYNNYIAGVGDAGINVDAGESDDTSGMLTDHKVAYGVTVAFNTIVTGRGITIGSGKALQPKGIVVAYNILQGSGPLITATGGSQVSYTGNIVNGGAASMATGVMRVDPKLVKIGEVFKIGPGSPAIDAADARFPFVVDDIDGKPRVMPDIGADEVSSSAAKYGLLKETDVGPLAP